MNLPPNVRQILNSLKDYEPRIVGGAVRDYLLGRPIKDYDIASEATPKQVLAILPKGEIIGEKFGVVMVDGVEIATFRKEGKYVDHRHPSEVSFGTKEDDAKRRDFTINCIYYNPFNNLYYDPYKGQEDLKSGIIRCVGNPRERFGEDALRMMRAIRFAAQLNFRIEPETFYAIEALSKTINEISIERIREELSKIILASYAGRGLGRLIDSGLSKQIFDISHVQIRGIDDCPRNLCARLAFILVHAHERREKLLYLKYNSSVNTVMAATNIYQELAPIKMSEKDCVYRRLVYKCGNIEVLNTLLPLMGVEEKYFAAWLKNQNLDQLFKPPLPVNGYDLIEMGFDGPQIGRALDQIREMWFKNPKIKKEDIDFDRLEK